MNDACLCSCKCNAIKELNTWGVTLGPPQLLSISLYSFSDSIFLFFGRYPMAGPGDGEDCGPVGDGSGGGARLGPRGVAGGGDDGVLGGHHGAGGVEGSGSTESSAGPGGSSGADCGGRPDGGASCHGTVQIIRAQVQKQSPK
jgi:hypothetical protein